MCITNLEEQTTLNTYNLWKLALRSHINTDARTKYSKTCEIKWNYAEFEKLSLLLEITLKLNNDKLTCQGVIVH